MLNIHHPPQHPGDTSHPLINSPSVSPFVSLSIHLSLVICHGISLFLALSQQKQTTRRHGEEVGPSWTAALALDAYFPTEYLTDHSVVRWLFGLFVSEAANKTFKGSAPNFNRMDLIGCGLQKPRQLMWAQSNR